MYLIYGSEQMFVKSYTKKLCEAVAGKNPSDFNYHTFSGDIDFQELAASLQIMPFMAERNCVVVTDIYFDNMVKDRLDTLKELTSRAWDGTVLIISMPTYVPSKNKTSFTALIKRVEKSAASAVLKNQFTNYRKVCCKVGKRKRQADFTPQCVKDYFKCRR